MALAKYANEGQRRHYSVSVDRDVYQRLLANAKRRGTPISQLIDEALERETRRD